MIIDFHTHIFPKKIRANRKNFFSTEPAFKLLYNSPKAKLIGIQELIDVMDEDQVDISVVFGFPWKNPDVCRMNNDYIIEAVKRFPERVKGFCCFDLFNDNALNEIKRCIDEGLSGVGELALYESGIDAKSRKLFEPIMKICLQKDLPILVHTNEPIGHEYPGKTPNTLNQIYKLIKNFPDNKIILAHWGGGLFFYNFLKKEVKDALKNVYFDTAASPFLYVPNIYASALEIAGKDKILFGSDFPLIRPSRYFKELETAALLKEDIKRICGLNAKKLLKL